MSEAERRAEAAIADLAGLASASHADLPAGRARWLETFTAARAEPARRSRVVWASTALAAAATAALGFYRWHRPAAALAFDVHGTTSSNGYVEASPGAPARVSFSDGSEVALSPASRVRVDHLTPFGSDVLLDGGSVNVHVVPRQKNAWFVHAGPFEIDVVGTIFSTQWDHVTGQLRVVVDEGKVLVRGPLKDPVAVTGGERLDANLISGEEIVRPVSVASLPPEIPEPAPALSTEPREETRAAHKPAEGTVSWRQLLASGHFEQVLALAEARGTDACVANCSLDDLQALSDAARYRGQTSLGRRSLLALRSRFARSDAAAKAAFLLGRMSQDTGNPGAAVTWFATYLTESKGGPLSVEALGREMQAQVAASGEASARPLAQKYLSQFPSGPHAAEARQILGSP